MKNVGKGVNITFIESLSNSYTMACLPVRGGKLVSGLSPVKADKPW